MATGDSHQVNGFSADGFPRYIPRQPPNPAPENAWGPPAPANNQREDIPPPGRGVAEPGRIQDPAYQGIADFRPQPLPPNPAYNFPAQGIPGPAQGQHDAPVNQEHNPFGYGPPHVEPGLVQAAFHPYIHRIPTPYPPRQAGAENLRQLARNYLHHPDADVRTVTMEVGPTGRITVALIFETPE